MEASAQSTDGAAQNIQRIAKGKAELGFANRLYYIAYEGHGNYEGKPRKNLRALAPLYADHIHLLVRKDLSIKSIADLKGKRVSTGAAGSDNETIAKTLLRSAGLDPEKDLRCKPLRMSDTISAMEDKQIDAALALGALLIPGVVEMFESGIVELISLPDDIVNKVQDELPYMSPVTIPAGTYPGQQKDVKTAGSWNVLLIDQKVDTDLVYEMTRTLFENKKELLLISPRIEGMDIANLKYVQIPIHPGAKKYYEEMGAVR